MNQKAGPIYKKDHTLHFATLPQLVEILTDEVLEAHEKLRETLLLMHPAFLPSCLPVLDALIAQFFARERAGFGDGGPAALKEKSDSNRPAGAAGAVALRVQFHQRQSASRRIPSAALARSGSGAGHDLSNVGGFGASGLPLRAGGGNQSSDDLQQQQMSAAVSMRQLRVLSLIHVWLKRDFAPEDLGTNRSAKVRLGAFLVELTHSDVPAVRSTAGRILPKLRAVSAQRAALPPQTAGPGQEPDSSAAGGSGRRTGGKAGGADEMERRLHACSQDISALEGADTLREQGTLKVLTTVLPKKLVAYDLLEFDPCQLAKQLTLIDFVYIYRHINPRALVTKRWTRRDDDRGDWATVKCVDLFNERVRWVGTELTRLELQPAARVKMLQHFIDMALESLRLRNFHLLFQLVGGIEQQFITSLKNLWVSLPESYIEEYQRLTAIVSSKANYREYRSLLADAASNGERHLPYLGVVLKDLTMLHEGLPSFHDEQPDMINFDKFVRLSDVIRDVIFVQRQDWTSDLKHDVELQVTLVSACSKARSLEELFRRGRKLEAQQGALFVENLVESGFFG